MAAVASPVAPLSPLGEADRVGPDSMHFTAFDVASALGVLATRRVHERDGARTRLQRLVTDYDAGLVDFARADDVRALTSVAYDLRLSGIRVVEAVAAWRACLVALGAASSFRPFLWKGRNYLETMVHDLDFLADVDAIAAVFRIDAAKLHGNPFVSPEPVANVTQRFPQTPAHRQLLATLRTHESLESLPAAEEFAASNDRVAALLYLQHPYTSDDSPSSATDPTPPLRESEVQRALADRKMLLLLDHIRLVDAQTYLAQELQQADAWRRARDGRLAPTAASLAASASAPVLGAGASRATAPLEAARGRSTRSRGADSSIAGGATAGAGMGTTSPARGRPSSRPASRSPSRGAAAPAGSSAVSGAAGAGSRPGSRAATGRWRAGRGLAGILGADDRDATDGFPSSSSSSFGGAAVHSHGRSLSPSSSAAPAASPYSVPMHMVPQHGGHEGPASSTSATTSASRPGTTAGAAHGVPPGTDFLALSSSFATPQLYAPLLGARSRIALGSSVAPASASTSAPSSATTKVATGASSPVRRPAANQLTRLDAASPTSAGALKRVPSSVSQSASLTLDFPGDGAPSPSDPARFSLPRPNRPTNGLADSGLSPSPSPSSVTKASLVPIPPSARGDPSGSRVTGRASAPSSPTAASGLGTPSSPSAVDTVAMGEEAARALLHRLRPSTAPAREVAEEMEAGREDADAATAAAARADAEPPAAVVAEELMRPGTALERKDADEDIEDHARVAHARSPASSSSSSSSSPSAAQGSCRPATERPDLTSSPSYATSASTHSSTSPASSPPSSSPAKTGLAYLGTSELPPVPEEDPDLVYLYGDHIPDWLRLPPQELMRRQAERERTAQRRLGASQRIKAQREEEALRKYRERVTVHTTVEIEGGLAFLPSRAAGAISNLNHLASTAGRGVGGAAGNTGGSLSSTMQRTTGSAAGNPAENTFGVDYHGVPGAKGVGSRMGLPRTLGASASAPALRAAGSSSRPNAATSGGVGGGSSAAATTTRVQPALSTGSVGIQKTTTPSALKRTEGRAPTTPAGLATGVRPGSVRTPASAAKGAARGTAAAASAGSAGDATTMLIPLSTDAALSPSRVRFQPEGLAPAGTTANAHASRPLAPGLTRRNAPGGPLPPLNRGPGPLLPPGTVTPMRAVGRDGAERSPSRAGSSASPVRRPPSRSSSPSAAATRSRVGMTMTEALGSGKKSPTKKSKSKVRAVGAAGLAASASADALSEFERSLARREARVARANQRRKKEQNEIRQGPISALKYKDLGVQKGASVRGRTTRPRRSGAPAPSPYTRTLPMKDPLEDPSRARGGEAKRDPSLEAHRRLVQSLPPQLAVRLSQPDSLDLLMEPILQRKERGVFDRTFGSGGEGSGPSSGASSPERSTGPAGVSPPRKLGGRGTHAFVAVGGGSSMPGSASSSTAASASASASSSLAGSSLFAAGMAGSALSAGNARPNPASHAQGAGGKGARAAASRSDAVERDPTSLAALAAKFGVTLPASLTAVDASHSRSSSPSAVRASASPAGKGASTTVRGVTVHDRPDAESPPAGLDSSSVASLVSLDGGASIASLDSRFSGRSPESLPPSFHASTGPPPRFDMRGGYPVFASAPRPYDSVDGGFHRTGHGHGRERERGSVAEAHHGAGSLSTPLRPTVTWAGSVVDKDGDRDDSRGGFGGSGGGLSRSSADSAGSDTSTTSSIHAQAREALARFNERAEAKLREALGTASAPTPGASAARAGSLPPLGSPAVASSSSSSSSSGAAPPTSSSFTAPVSRVGGGPVPSSPMSIHAQTAAALGGSSVRATASSVAASITSSAVASTIATGAGRTHNSSSSSASGGGPTTEPASSFAAILAADDLDRRIRQQSQQSATTALATTLGGSLATPSGSRSGFWGPAAAAAPTGPSPSFLAPHGNTIPSPGPFDRMGGLSGGPSVGSVGSDLFDAGAGDGSRSRSYQQARAFLGRHTDAGGAGAGVGVGHNGGSVGNVGGTHNGSGLGSGVGAGVAAGSSLGLRPSVHEPPPDVWASVSLVNEPVAAPTSSATAGLNRTSPLAGSGVSFPTASTAAPSGVPAPVHVSSVPERFETPAMSTVDRAWLSGAVFGDNSEVLPSPEAASLPPAPPAPPRASSERGRGPPPLPPPPPSMSDPPRVQRLPSLESGSGSREFGVVDSSFGMGMGMGMEGGSGLGLVPLDSLAGSVDRTSMPDSMLGGGPSDLPYEGEDGDAGSLGSEDFLPNPSRRETVRHSQSFSHASLTDTLEPVAEGGSEEDHPGRPTHEG